jgi:hypothetical protein
VSANSGAEIYNRALMTGSDVAGAPFSTLLPSAAGPRRLPIAGDPNLTNPRADATTTGWTAGSNGGSSAMAFARDTAAFTSPPASFKVSGSAGFISTTFWTRATLAAGYTFKAGKTYVLVFNMYVTQPNTVQGPPASGTAFFGAAVDFSTVTGSMYATVGADGYVQKQYVTPAGDRGRLDLNPFFQTPTTTPVWTEVAVPWVPRADVASGSVEFGWISGSNPVFPTAVGFDDFQILIAAPTIVDKRGFSRTMQLPIESAMPSDDDTALRTIGDIWLKAHKTTPFKGSITVTGDAAVRETLTGQSVPAGVLLSRTNEIVRLMDRVDPDTGGLGRDARIANVSYTPATATAVVTLDNTRDLLAPLLARMAVVTGNTR